MKVGRSNTRNTRNRTKRNAIYSEVKSSPAVTFKFLGTIRDNGGLFACTDNQSEHSDILQEEFQISDDKDMLAKELLVVMK